MYTVICIAPDGDTTHFRSKRAAAIGLSELTGCEVSEYTVNVIASRGDDVLGYKLSYSNGDQQQEASDPAAEEEQVADGIFADGAIGLSNSVDR